MADNLTRVAAPRMRHWLLWLIPPLLAWLLWLVGGTVAIDVGGLTDRNVTSNFYDREQNERDTYRWSTDASTLSLPAHALPGILTLRGAPAPDGTQVMLRLGEQTAVNLPTREGSAEMRVYRMLWPEESDAGGWVTLHILSQPPEGAAQRSEERRIGLLVAHVHIDSLDQPPPLLQRLSTLPPVGLLLAFGLLPLLLALCLRMAGLGLLASTALSLGPGIALVLVWGWQPLWVQPFLFRSLFALLALTALLAWMRQVTQHRPATSLPWVLVLLVAVAGLIPLYLLVKYSILPDLTFAETIEHILHPDNLPVLAMLAALALPFARARLRTALVVVIIVALLGHGIEQYQGAILKDYATDFTAMFRGVRSFTVEGEALYNLEHINMNHLGDTYKYPPFFVFLMAPIAGLYYVEAILAWHLFNFVLLLAAAVLLWRWSGQPLRSWSTLGLVYLLLAFKPVVDSLSSGQADILMLVSLAAALLALSAGRWAWWGAVLAFPAAIKLYAGYLLFHAVALRKWRALAAFAGAFAVLNLLALLAFGWRVHETFLFDVLPNIGGGTAWVENQTINGFLNRLAAERIGLIPEDSGTIRMLTYLSALLLTGLTFWRVQRMTPAAGFGLWMVTLLIILPIAWMHYQAILLIPLYQLFVRLDQHAPDLDWRSLLLYALAWMLLAYGNQWTFFDRTMYEGPLWSLVLSYKLYGLLLLWGALAFDPTARTRPLAEQQPEQVRQSSPVMQT
jgi:hypothetical protein